MLMGGDGCGCCGGGGCASEACGEYKTDNNHLNTTRQNKYITKRLNTLKLW